LITCNLTKPETTLDHVKKALPKLPQTDAALVATAIVLSGRHAKAVYEDKAYTWSTEGYNSLTKAMLGHLHSIQVSLEPAKKTKAILLAMEEEVVEVKIGLVANIEEGEKILAGREDLKTIFSDLVHKGVEYQYSPLEIGWQWALDRANWHTLSDGELTRRIKHKATFQGDAIGTEMGLSGPKKRASKKAAAIAEAAEADVEVEVETPIVEDSAE